jgi:hypothetical protein
VHLNRRQPSQNTAQTIIFVRTKRSNHSIRFSRFPQTSKNAIITIWFSYDEGTIEVLLYTSGNVYVSTCNVELDTPFARDGTVATKAVLKNVAAADRDLLVDKNVAVSVLVSIPSSAMQ